MEDEEDYYEEDEYEEDEPYDEEEYEYEEEEYEEEDEEGDGSIYKYLSVFTEVLNLIRQAYVEPTPTDSLFQGALDGTTDALGPFATFVPASEVVSDLRQIDSLVGNDQVEREFVQPLAADAATTVVLRASSSTQASRAARGRSPRRPRASSTSGPSRSTSRRTRTPALK